MYVIVTNHVNWHRENLLSDRENTGNLKTHFEWVPCTDLDIGRFVMEINHMLTIVNNMALTQLEICRVEYRITLPGF